MATQTITIDSQVHAYERNRPERPWNGFLEGPDEVTGDDMVAADERGGRQRGFADFAIPSVWLRRPAIYSRYSRNIPAGSA